MSSKLHITKSANLEYNFSYSVLRGEKMYDLFNFFINGTNYNSYYAKSTEVKGERMEAQEEWLPVFAGLNGLKDLHLTG